MADLDFLKANVFPGESGGDYNALFGYANRPGGQFAGFNLSDMTIDQALAFADPKGPYAQSVKNQIGRVATPMGAYQIVGTTLRAAKEGLGLTGNERMTPAMQDQLGMWIYKNQGPGAWVGWGKKGGGGSASTSTSNGGSTMAGLLDMPEQDQGGLVRLLTGENKPWASKMNDIGAVLLALAGSPAAQPLLEMTQRRRERRDEMQNANRTAQWLASRGRPDLAEALMSGAIDPKTAVATALTPAAETPAAFRSLEAQAKAAGLQPGTKEYQDFMLYGGGTKDEIPASFKALQMQAEAAGLKPGTPEYENFMLTRGAYDTALGRAAGAAAGEAQIDLPGAAITAARTIKMVDEIIADPALPDMVGPIQGRLPDVSPEAQRFSSRLRQLKGTAFLEAYSMLRGGGQITENEGNKAEDAMIRLNTAQSEEDFLQALQDFKDAVTMGYQKLQARAGGGTASPGSGQAPAPEAGGPAPTDDPLGLRQPKTGG